MLIESESLRQVTEGTQLAITGSYGENPLPLGMWLSMEG